MKGNIKTLHLSFVIALILTVVMSANVFAATTTSNIALVKTGDTSYIIYAENMTDTFKYMITEENIEPTSYDVSSLDANGNNVATLNTNSVSQTDNLYLWIKDSQNNVTTTNIDVDDYIDYEKLVDMNTITKRIAVDTDEEKITVTDSENQTSTVTVGKTVITDDSTKSYKYSLKKVDSDVDAQKLDELIELINSFDSNTDMYTVVTSYKKVNELCDNILDSATWEDVENMEILQPEDAKHGEKYILALRMLDEEVELKSDIQILTSIRDYDEGVNQLVIKETVVKPVKLPVTGDNIFLIIGFLLLIFALILLVILKRKTSQKENV